MVTFDGVNKLIICDAGTVSLSVKAMYSMWKEWMLISDNSKYPQAFRVVGGDPTVGNNVITPYFFLLNGWKIRPQEANHTLSVDGILLTDDSSDAFTDTLGIFRIGINQIVPIYTESVLMETGVSGLTPEESSRLSNIPTAEETWNYQDRTITSAPFVVDTDVNVISVNNIAVAGPDDFKATEVGLSLTEQQLLQRAADDSTAVMNAMKGGWKKMADGTVIFYHEDGTEFCRLKQKNSADETVHDGSWALLP